MKKLRVISLPATCHLLGKGLGRAREIAGLGPQ